MNFSEMDQVIQPSYTAIVLDDQSKSKLLQAISIPKGYEVICHHCTINLGGADKGPTANRLGEKTMMTAVAIAQDAKVIAVKVETAIPSVNQTKHITIAVNRAAGGKPFDSNKLTAWEPMNPIHLVGSIEECGKGDVVLRKSN